MKKWLAVLLFLLFTLGLSGSVSAASYDMQVLNGFVEVDPGGGIIAFTNPAPGTLPSQLDPSRDPFATGPDIFPIDPLPSGGWNAAGWWEFAVIGSTGSDWNDFFAGGDAFYEITWDGIVETSFGTGPMPTAIFDTTAAFGDIYGKWYENKTGVWTYFGLYVEPNGDLAQLTGPPLGIFGFVASDPEGNYDWPFLYQALENGPRAVVGGLGNVTAIPEPSTMFLFGAGLLGLTGIGRKKFLKK